MSISTTASPFEFLDGVKAVGPYFLSTLDVLISFVSLRGPTAFDALLERRERARHLAHDDDIRYDSHWNDTE